MILEILPNLPMEFNVINALLDLMWLYVNHEIDV